MKKIFWATVFITLFSFIPAQASEDGWVKVDANGVVQDGVYVCSAEVCGDRNSEYNKLVLKPGEQWVLQFKADPITKNVAGFRIVEGVTMTVDLETNEWTRTYKGIQQSEDEPNIDLLIETTERWNPLITEGLYINVTKQILERLERMDAGLSNL